VMIDKDSFQKFMFETLQIRGEWVRLNDSFSAAVNNKHYPAEIKRLVGETALASVLLTGTLKFEGLLSIHARGKGPVSLLMSEARNDKTFRCLANYDADSINSDNLLDLVGAAQLAITIDPDKGKRYQGIVPLERAQVGECLAHYFELSEQLDSYFLLQVGEDGAYGLMLQKLPDYREIEDQDAWNRILQLAKTLTCEEFAAADNLTLTTRLFHEEEVLLFDKEPVRFNCSCSEERSLSSIKALGQDEALGILEDEVIISIDCQFCGEHYEFDRTAIHALFNVGMTH
jgi:molecular chaperone Hsp33